MSLSLYQIANEHRAMVASLMESTDDAQAIADTIEAESYSLEVKAQNVAYAVKNLDATAAAIKEAEKEMAARRKAIENRAQHLREYAMTCMQIAGVTKIDCPHFAISIRTNPVSINVFEPALIPAQYMRKPEAPPPAPDKILIKEAIKAGIEVPGAVAVQTQSLKIA